MAPPCTFLFTHRTPVLTLLPHTTRPVNHTKYLKLKAHIILYKGSKPLTYSPMYSTSTHIYPLIRIGLTQPPIVTCALPTHLNCTHIAQIADQALETNYRIISKLTTIGMGAATPSINPRPSILHCQNYTTPIPPETELTKGSYNATSDKNPEDSYTYQNHTL